MSRTIVPMVLMLGLVLTGSAAAADDLAVGGKPAVSGSTAGATATAQPAGGAPVAATQSAPAPASPVVSASAPSVSGGAQPGALPKVPDDAASKAVDEASGAFRFAAATMTGFLAIALLGFMRSLSRSTTWSLGDALSEEAGNQPTLPPGQRPVLVASTSRTIALFGLFVIIGAFLGIGYYIVWALFHGRALTGLEQIVPFFYGSAAIFAPYAVNQMKEAFTSLAGAPNNQQSAAAPAATAPAARPAPSVSAPAPQVVVQPVLVTPAAAVTAPSPS